MRCLICGGEMLTAGCSTEWKHGSPAFPVSFAYPPTPDPLDPRDGVIARLRETLLLIEETTNDPWAKGKARAARTGDHE